MVATDYLVITADKEHVLKISADDDGIWLADALDDMGYLVHFSHSEAQEIIDCITHLLHQ